MLPKFLLEGNERDLKFKNIILHCIIFLHCIRKWEKILFHCIPKYVEENLFRCIPKWRKTSVVSQNGGKPPLYPTTNRRKPLPLYPTMEENLFHCGIHRKKTCIVVGYNAEELLCCIPLCVKIPLFYLILL
jgi:hypothetical protein